MIYKALSQIEAEICASQQSQVLANRIMKDNWIEVLNSIQITQNLLVYQIVPTLINDQIKNHFSVYQPEEIKKMNEDLIRTFFGRIHFFNQQELISSLYASPAAISLILSYDYTKLTIYPIIFEALKQSDELIVQCTLVYIETLISKVFDYIDDSKVNNYRTIFRPYREDFIQNFVHKVIEICLYNTQINKCKQTLILYNVILNLDPKVDFMKDHWLTRTNLKAFKYPENFIHQLVNLFCNESFLIFISEKYIDEHQQRISFEITSSLFWAMKRCGTSQKGLYLKVISHLNDYMLRIRESNQQLPEGFMKLLPFTMSFDLQTLSEGEVLQKFLGNLLTLTNEQLNQAQTTGSSTILDNILDAWAAFVVNIRSQDYSTLNQGIQQNVLEFIVQYVQLFPQNLSNKWFRMRCKTITNLWISNFLNQLNTIVKQKFQVFQQQMTQNSASDFSKYFQIFTLCLFGCIRSTEFMMHVKCDYSDRLGVYKQSLSYNHNDAIYLPTIDIVNENNINTICEALRVTLDIIKVIKINYLSNDILQLSYTSFIHKYAKFILLNSSHYLNIKQILNQLYPNDLIEQVLQEINYIFIYVSDITYGGSTQYQRSLSLKHLRMISQVLCFATNQIKVGDLIIPKQLFDTFFQQQLIIQSFDFKHRDTKEIYECLGYIAQKIRYRAGTDQDQCFVNIMMQPYLQIVMNTGINNENLYAYLQNLRGIQKHIETLWHEGETMYTLVKTIGLLDYTKEALKFSYMNSNFHQISFIMNFYQSLTNYSAQFGDIGLEIMTTHVYPIIQILISAIEFSINQPLSASNYYSLIIKPIKIMAQIFVNLHEKEFFKYHLIPRIPTLKQKFLYILQGMFQLVGYLQMEDFINYTDKLRVLQTMIHTITFKHRHFYTICSEPQFSKILGLLGLGIKSLDRYAQRSFDCMLECILRVNENEESNRLRSLFSVNQDIITTIIDNLIQEIFQYMNIDENQLRIFYGLSRLAPELVTVRINKLFGQSATTILNSLNDILLQCKTPYNLGQKTFVAIIRQKTQ